jgi:Type II CAAX prenyl endopeptidase Rce1-like
MGAMVAAGAGVVGETRRRWPGAAVVGLGAAGAYAVVETGWSTLPEVTSLRVSWQLSVVLHLVLVVLGTTVGGAALALRRQRAHMTPLSGEGGPLRPGWQLLAALAVFPLAAAVRAVAYLVQVGVYHQPQAARVSDLVPGHAGWSALLWALGDLAEIGAAVGLVALLLRLSGEGGLGALGPPDRTWRELDLRRALFVSVLVFAVPQGVGRWLLHMLHVTGIGLTETGLPKAYLWSELVSAVNAGFVEEIVVLGFLVHRLRQRGWPAAGVIAAAVAVRVSFHLYYGWGALPMALWATGVCRGVPAVASTAGRAVRAGAHRQRRSVDTAGLRPGVAERLTGDRFRLCRDGRLAGDDAAVLVVAGGPAAHPMRRFRPVAASYPPCRGCALHPTAGGGTSAGGHRAGRGPESSDG